MTSIQSIDSLVLELPPSCLEFCPHDPQYAVVGTYSLERSNADAEDSAPEVEKSQSRSGSLILIRVDGDSV
jgi:diphthamide biosynthesis protein 7